MILTLLKAGWLNLKRDRVAQALTFLLPIVFFSIFASVFGGQGGDTTPRIRVAVVDEDGSEFSRRVVEGMKKEDGLRVQTGTSAEPDAPALDRQSAERIVRNGDVPIADIVNAHSSTDAWLDALACEWLRRRRQRAPVLVRTHATDLRPIMPDALLDEVTALVEWPVVYAGSFDAAAAARGATVFSGAAARAGSSVRRAQPAGEANLPPPPPGRSRSGRRTDRRAARGGPRRAHPSKAHAPCR